MFWTVPWAGFLCHSQEERKQGLSSNTFVNDLLDSGLIPGSGRSPGEGNSNSLQYSCLENSMDRGACGLQSMRSQRVGHDWSDFQLLMFVEEKHGFPFSHLIMHNSNLPTMPRKYIWWETFVLFGRKPSWHEKFKLRRSGLLIDNFPFLLLVCKLWDLNCLYNAN